MTVAARQHPDGVIVALSLNCASCGGVTEIAETSDTTTRLWQATIACHECATEDRLTIRLDTHRRLDGRRRTVRNHT